MSFSVRWEQCCENAGCTRPAHIGTLCSPCFMAASPARRAVELLADAPDPAPAAGHQIQRPRPLPEYVSDQGAAWLAQLWAA